MIVQTECLENDDHEQSLADGNDAPPCAAYGRSSSVREAEIEEPVPKDGVGDGQRCGQQRDRGRSPCPAIEDPTRPGWFFGEPEVGERREAREARR